MDDPASIHLVKSVIGKKWFYDNSTPPNIIILPEVYEHIFDPQNIPRGSYTWLQLHGWTFDSFYSIWRNSSCNCTNKTPQNNRPYHTTKECLLRGWLCVSGFYFNPIIKECENVHCFCTSTTKFLQCNQLLRPVHTNPACLPEGWYFESGHYINRDCVCRYQINGCQYTNMTPSLKALDTKLPQHVNSICQHTKLSPKKSIMRNIALAFGNTDKIEVDVDGCINMGVGTINADVIPPFTSQLYNYQRNGINTSTSCYSSSDNLSEMCTPANGGGVDDNSSTKEIDVIRSNDCKTITDTTTTVTKLVNGDDDIDNDNVLLSSPVLMPIPTTQRVIEKKSGHRKRKHDGCNKHNSSTSKNTMYNNFSNFGSIIQKKKKTRKIINGTYFDNGELDNKSFGILHKTMNVDKKTKEREKTTIDVR